MCEFMENIFNIGVVERVLEILNGYECWYILIFVVIYLKKFGKVCVVFDFLIVY